MDMNKLKYYQIINGLTNGRTCKDSLMNEMVDSYNTARDNLITRFDVMINSNMALDVFINKSEESIKAIIDTKKKYSAESNEQESIQVYPNLIKSGDYVRFKKNDTDEFKYYLITSEIKKELTYDEGIFVKCDKTIYWNEENIEIICPAYVNNSSQTNTNDFISTLNKLTDMKISIQISNNIEENKNIPNWITFKELYPNTRFQIVQRQDNVNEGLINLSLIKDIYVDNVDIINYSEYEDDNGITRYGWTVSNKDYKSCIRNLSAEDVTKEWGYNVELSHVLYVQNLDNIEESSLIKYDNVIYKTIKFIKYDNPDKRLDSFYMIGLVKNEEQNINIVESEVDSNE